MSKAPSKRESSAIAGVIDNISPSELHLIFLQMAENEERESKKSPLENEKEITAYLGQINKWEKEKPSEKDPGRGLHMTKKHKKDLRDILEQTTKRHPFTFKEDVDEEYVKEYAKTVQGFIDGFLEKLEFAFIPDGAGGYVKVSTPKVTQVKAIKAICKFLLTCKNIDQETLISTFPGVMGGDRQCLDGVAEQLTDFMPPESVLLQHLKLSSGQALKTVSSSFKAHVHDGHMIHIHDYLSHLIKGTRVSTDVSYDFSIPSSKLYDALVGYEEEFHSITKKSIEGMDVDQYEIELKKIAESVVDSFEVEEDRAPLRAMLQKGGYVVKDFNSPEFAKFQENKIVFEAEMVSRLQRSLKGVNEDDDKDKDAGIRAIDNMFIFGSNDGDEDYLRLNYDTVATEMQRARLQLMKKELEITARDAGIDIADDQVVDTAVDVRDSSAKRRRVGGDEIEAVAEVSEEPVLGGKRRPKDSVAYLSSKRARTAEVEPAVVVGDEALEEELEKESEMASHASPSATSDALSRKLSSSNSLERDSAIKEIFAFSKSGIGSLLVHVFRPEVREAVEKLSKDKSVPAYLQVMLKEYADRWGNIHKVDKTFEGYINREKEFAALNEDMRRFILSNSSSSELLEILEKDSSQVLLLLEESNKTLAVGTGISAYRSDSYLWSLLSRSDFPSLLPKLVTHLKACTNGEDVAIEDTERVRHEKTKATGILLKMLVTARGMHSEHRSLISSAILTKDLKGFVNINSRIFGGLLLKYLQVSNYVIISTNEKFEDDDSFRITKEDAIYRGIFYLMGVLKSQINDPESTIQLRTYVKNYLKHILYMAISVDQSELFQGVTDSFPFEEQHYADMLMSAIDKGSLNVADVILQSDKRFNMDAAVLTDGDTARTVMLRMMAAPRVHRDVVKSGEIIELLLTSRVSEGRPIESRKILRDSINHGTLDAAKFILNKTPDVEKDKTFQTLLLSMIRTGKKSPEISIKGIKLLLDQGVKSDFTLTDPNKQEHTPIKYAVALGRMDVVKLLLEKGVSSRSKNLALKQVAEKKVTDRSVASVNAGIMELLLRSGATLNIHPEDFELQNRVFRYAIFSRHKGLMSAWAESADLTMKNSEGLTPLMMVNDLHESNAAIGRLIDARYYLEILNLLSQPEYLDKITPKGQTQLTCATREGREKEVSLLLDRGANPMIPDSKNQRPIALSLTSSSETLSHLFLREPCINAQDRDGKTILRLVIDGDIGAADEDQSLDILSKLLNNGANPNIADAATGTTPLMSAVQKGEILMIGELLRHQITNLNCRDSNGDTVFMIACRDGNEYLIEALIADERNDVTAADLEKLKSSGVNLELRTRISELVKALPNKNVHRLRTYLDDGNEVPIEEMDVILLPSDEESAAGVSDLISRALDTAAANGHLKVIELLLGTNPSADSIDSALGRAAKNGRLKIVELLLNTNSLSADGISNALDMAVENDRLEVVEKILSEGEQKFNLETMSQALVMAAGSGKHGMVKDLLGVKDINLNQVNKGVTALVAAANTDDKMIKLLLDKAKTLRVKLSHRKEALIAVIKNTSKKEDLFKDLFCKRAIKEVNVEDRKEILIKLIKCNRGREARTILSFDDISWETKDSEGNNILMMMASSSSAVLHNEAVKLMKALKGEQHANALNDVNDKGQTLMMVATAESHHDTSSNLLKYLLEQHRAAVKSLDDLKTDNEGLNIIMIAAVHNINVLSSLLSEDKGLRLVRDDKIALLKKRSHDGSNALMITSRATDNINSDASFRKICSYTTDGIDYALKELIRRNRFLFGTQSINDEVERNLDELLDLAVEKDGLISWMGIRASQQSKWSAKKKLNVVTKSFLDSLQKGCVNIPKHIVEREKITEKIAAFLKGLPIDEMMLSAIENNHVNVVKFLLDSKSLPRTNQDNGLLMLTADQKDRPDIVELLSQPKYINSADSSGKTPLVNAYIRNDIETFSLLLDKGAHPIDLDKEGPRSLVASVVVNDVNPEIKKLILEKSYLDMRDQNGCTALDSIVRMEMGRGGEVEQAEQIERRKKGLKELLDAGANPNAIDNKGVSPLSRAINMGGRHDLIEILLEKKSTFVSAHSEDGNSPLMVAIGHDDAVTVHLISSKRGIKINDKTSGGDSLVKVAVKSASPRVLELLLESKDLKITPEDLKGIQGLSEFSTLSKTLQKRVGAVAASTVDGKAPNATVRPARGFESAVGGRPRLHG